MSPKNQPPLPTTPSAPWRSLPKSDARRFAENGALQNAILNSANFSSIATDERGVIQIFNVGAVRMLGYAATASSIRYRGRDSDPRVARAKALKI